jgi:hypothetical protein
VNRRCALGLCTIALLTIPAFPNGSLAQGKSLKDQLIGTWIYVSSTGKRDDGSTVARPSLQGAVTYTADGRFHFITVRTDAPKLASSDPSRPSPEEAIAIASGSIAYTGTYTVDENTKTIHANVEAAGESGLRIVIATRAEVSAHSRAGRRDRGAAAASRGAGRGANIRH